MRLFELRASDIISAADELEVSQYSTQEKIGWLSNLDGQIWDEIVMTHVFPFWKVWRRHLWHGDPLDQGIRGEQYPPFWKRRPKPEEETPDGEEEPEIEVDLEPDTPEEPGGGGRDRRERHRFWRWPYTSPDSLLIAGNPYGKDMYLYYLQSKIAYHNAEQAKYAIYSAAYNDAYSKFAAWYNRTYMPGRIPGGNRFRF